MKKNLLYFVGIVVVSIIIYSCNNNEGLDNLKKNEFGISDIAENLSARIDSYVSMEDCETYIDFHNSCMDLAEITGHFMASLTQEEREEIYNHLNDDDYMLIIAERINAEKELQMVEIAKNKMLNNTSFSTFSREKQMELFSVFPEYPSNSILKSRAEGGNTKTECERRWNEDYAYATAHYTIAMAACACSGITGPGACLCALAASVAYKKEISDADRDYYDCLANAK